MPINYYNDRVCLNVLGGSLQNAADIYKAAEGHVEVGVLTADYDTVEAAIEDMNKYMDVLEGNLSVGLGGGGEHDDPPRSAPLRFQFPQGLYQRFQHHDHAGPAAVRTVIHNMVAVFRPVAGVQDIEFDKPRLTRLAEQRRIQRGLKPFRKQSQYVDSHSCRVEIQIGEGGGEKFF